MRILVTGATGYVGSRLVPQLLAEGHEVVCFARNPDALAAAPWRDRVRVVAGDLLDQPSIERALEGCDAAYYLVHSIGKARDFGRIEAECAGNFRTAADASSLRRVIYLGGLGPDDELSRHLSSRHQVGSILAAGRVPVVELRAAVVIGSGSLSFELLRYITEVLPVMTTPRWVRSRCQPIAIRDLVLILAAAATGGPERGIVEIGGPDVVSYEEMMRMYAEEAGLMRRLIIPLPILSPGLSSLWVGLVTPLPPAVARPLIASLRHDVVVAGGGTGGFQDIPRTPLRASIRDALAALTAAPGSMPGNDPAASLESDPAWAGGTEFVDRRSVDTPAPLEHVVAAFNRIGGVHGYYTANWAWSLRGRIDRAVGGPGLRRGRSRPDRVQTGDVVDFWTVASAEPDRRLLLEAEMKLPGRAWLEFTAEQTADGTRLIQTAYFRPRGLVGRLYWALLWPAHVVIFRRMANRIAHSAARQ